MQHWHGLLQIEDVDLVALTENERLHARVPAASAVTKMDTSFEHLAH